MPALCTFNGVATFAYAEDFDRLDYYNEKTVDAGTDHNWHIIPEGIL